MRRLEGNFRDFYGLNNWFAVVQFQLAWMKIRNKTANTITYLWRRRRKWRTGCDPSIDYGQQGTKSGIRINFRSCTGLNSTQSGNQWNTGLITSMQHAHPTHQSIAITITITITIYLIKLSPHAAHHTHRIRLSQSKLRTRLIEHTRAVFFLSLLLFPSRRHTDTVFRFSNWDLLSIEAAVGCACASPKQHTFRMAIMCSICCWRVAAVGGDVHGRRYRLRYCRDYILNARALNTGPGEMIIWNYKWCWYIIDAFFFYQLGTSQVPSAADSNSNNAEKPRFDSTSRFHFFFNFCRRCFVLFMCALRWSVLEFRGILWWFRVFFSHYTAIFIRYWMIVW